MQTYTKTESIVADAFVLKRACKSESIHREIGLGAGGVQCWWDIDLAAIFQEDKGLSAVVGNFFNPWLPPDAQCKLKLPDPARDARETMSCVCLSVYLLPMTCFLYIRLSYSLIIYHKMYFKDDVNNVFFMRV